MRLQQKYGEGKSLVKVPAGKEDSRLSPRVEQQCWPGQAQLAWVSRGSRDDTEAKGIQEQSPRHLSHPWYCGVSRGYPNLRH